MPTRSILRPAQRTGPLLWLAAILCVIFLVMVIITGIVVLVVYMVYQPKMPYLRVPYAHLNSVVYDQSGLLTVEVAVNVEAVNDNRKADASFSDIGFSLRFYQKEIAELVAEPFDVPKNSSWALNYVVPASPIPLDREGMEEMDVAFRKDRVRFDLEGQGRTRWQVGIFARLKFWTHLSCNLQFSIGNGSSIGIDCDSKSY